MSGPSHGELSDAIRPRGRIAADNSAPLLEVDGLSVEFRTRHDVVHAVNDVSFALHEGETLAILGESGSGKSVTALAIMGLLESPPARITGGGVRFDGVDLLTLPRKERRRYQGSKIAIIFQDALSALNPVLSVGYQITEMIRAHSDASRKDARAQAIELMDHVRIPDANGRFSDYPHQFSGGMRQRVMIAMALAMRPDVLIADEPTTALDVTVQAQILQLLGELQEEYAMALMLITHDLAVTTDVADRVAVMYAGRIVETAPAQQLYAAPAHPYTAGLLRSVPRLEARSSDLEPITGSPPNLARIPSGCAFRPRCPHVRARCADELPNLASVADGRASACHFWPEVFDGRR
jgi:oligopeptide transport system ATP-binding protein